MKDEVPWTADAAPDTPPPFPSLEDAVRWLASRGGRARAEALTPERRRAISAKAGRARTRKLTALERKAIARLGGLARQAKRKGRDNDERRE